MISIQMLEEPYTFKLDNNIASIDIVSDSRILELYLNEGK